MGYLSNTNFNVELLEHWYEREDYIDMIQEFPELLEFSKEELSKKATELYWRAEGLISEANRLESYAELIKTCLEKGE